MVETRSGKMQDPAQERIKAEEFAKPQPGATIGRDASSDPVVLNPNIDIPKYDGTEDPRPWIESLEEIGFLYHWADYIISRYAAMNMTGSAKTWLNLHKASFTSWENIKIRLIQDFSLDANKEELRMKLNRMQHWNEPAIRFAEDILVLCNKVDPAMEEETKIEHVIGGLKKEYSFALYLNPPKTTDDLLVVCKKMDSFENKYRERVEKSRNLYNGPRYSRPQQQSRQYRNNFPQPSTPRRPYNPNFVPKPNLQRNTYNKSQEVSKNRTEDGRPICFKCNKPGHVARYCRVKFIRILEEDPADTQEKVEEKCQMNEISEKSGPRLYADALVETEDGEYIIEESSKMFQTNGLRLARSLINVINRETHIWITNPYPRPLKIMKNQTLAFGSSPAKINVSREREVEKNEEPRFQINENLSPKEQKELKQVLERLNDKKCRFAFEELEILNPNAPTYVHTDASNIGIGATLVQDIGGEEKVISYLSRTLSKAEQNYSTTEKECLAVVWSMSKLRPYLYGRHFKIVTDHHALCWLKNLKDPTGRLARWALKIQEYDFDIIHKSGKKHLDADGLSRGPLPETDWDEDFERLFLNQITDEEDKFIESVKKNLNGSRRSIAQNFKEEDGCLFKKNPNPEGRAWLLVVPENKKREIMKEYHNHMSNGHLGVARTMYRIKSKYFWPSMLKDVSEFVKTCHLCQTNFPFERIGIDFVGPLPSTKNRKKWIIVLTDYYTRYAETRAVSEATVKEVSKFLVEDIFLRHGAPQYLISDRGSQFTSNLMKEVMKTCKIKHCFTTSYHPQTNGLTERLNRTLINMLSMYVNTDQKNWDEILPFITHAYNTTIQETTGYSPFFLMFGREPTSLLDDRNISVDIDKDDYDEYIKHHLDKINRTRKLVINNTIKTQERMKKNYDKKHMERSYEPGELVAVWTPIRKIGKCEKLLRKYFGPYRILKKLSNVNYLIEPKDNPGQDPLIVHVSRLKPYFERIDENLDNNQVSTDQNLDSLVNTFSKQILNAMLAADMRIKVRPGRPKSKPWYSRECYLAKKSAKASLTTFKETNTDVDRNIYVSNRKRYTTLINFNKKKYLQEKQELLKNARDSANFWKTIATLKDKSYIQGNITILEWQCFYNKLLSAETTIGSDLSTLSRIDPELYCEISITEITREISSLANEKACGADEIPNEALKTLPFEHLVTLKNIFNRIINSGSYPLIWSKSIIHPIFKSGDRDNPSNYRGIALISNLSKLFTSILKSRLRNWIEGRSIIPENQAGFRKGYSCQDHIFTLLSLIQLTLRRKRRKLYAFFVDLKKAFDTVPHSLLWSKLGELGLDFRFVNLIRNYFEQMTTTAYTSLILERSTF
ncbi:hypothetical protein LAZ67_3002795 [Cordylochernes scorpioides]|uniref:RNA-directed DNA polymerase n=1 Tax=Cordylochernes scorpioides TaxID=51811 RepID=A0ABY6K843_9ARAC|nr:hypothetical protein LAZ67_3002795 [Cordylochernes scorpioides]